MNRKAAQGILNILIFLAALALIFVVGYPQYLELKPSTVRIGVEKTFGGLPFLLAELDTSHPYYKLEKIKPHFVDIQGDPLEKVMNGECDIAAVPWYDLLLRSGDTDDTVKVIGSLELRAVSDAIVVRADQKKIRSLRDLNGKRLGFLRSDEYLVDMIVKKMVQRDNIKEIIKVPLAVSEIASALDDKKADAVFVIDPYRGYLQYRGHVILVEGLINIYLMSAFPYQAVVMRRSFVEKSKKAAVRMKKTFDAVLAYIRSHPETARSDMVRINEWPIDGALLLNIRMPEYLRLPEIDLKKLEQLQGLMVLSGAGSCGMSPRELLFRARDFGD